METHTLWRIPLFNLLANSGVYLRVKAKPSLEYTTKGVKHYVSIVGQCMGAAYIEIGLGCEVGGAVEAMFDVQSGRGDNEARDGIT